MLDIIIAGGGPAGLTAALYARRAGLSAVIFERMFAGGQMASTASIENYPGFPGAPSGVDLALSMEEQARSAGADIQYKEVTGFQFADDRHTVFTADGGIDARAIILCMGASPRKLGAPGEERLAGAGVSYCATCDGAFFAGKPVAVIGGGNTAAEDALYLARTSSTVHLIHRRDRLRAESELARRVMETPNIVVHWNSVVEEMQGEVRLAALHVSKEGGIKENLAVEGAFVAVGVEPQTVLLRGGPVKLNDQGYVVAGEDTRTTVRRAYAAGDIREKPLRQVVTAAADGAVAVWAALQDP